VRGGGLAVIVEAVLVGRLLRLPDDAGASPLHDRNAFHLVDLTNDPVRYVCNSSGSGLPTIAIEEG
jgi:hypothetical protein